MYYAQLKIIHNRAVVVAITETHSPLPPLPSLIVIKSLDASLLGKTYIDGVFV